ncbi:hypothetical protein [Streptomyces fructofermentans]|uniref:hypothetical protein n=2 Tax=Streptomyces fructofermentans TaxID=152141 RepID=UPI0037BB48AF
MLTDIANEDSRLSLWLRVRRFAVPPSMIETATVRRSAGDWAGACAAAAVDVDLDLRSVARARGQDFAGQVRCDLRHLAPDLLRWHMPRIAPHGLLRPGLTIPLARYGASDRAGPRSGTVQLVARTAPAWADAGQRMSLALWDGAAKDVGARRHPHPRPSRRFRLDLHRHLWDTRTTGELRARSGADREPGQVSPPVPAEVLELAALYGPCAVDRWGAEAAILLGSLGRPTDHVVVRLGARQRLLLSPVADEGSPEPPGFTVAGAPTRGVAALPVLPDASTWTLPDLELIRSGRMEAGRLHPLVASALAPRHAAHPRPKPESSSDGETDGRGDGARDRAGEHYAAGAAERVRTPVTAFAADHAEVSEPTRRGRSRDSGRASGALPNAGTGPPRRPGHPYVVECRGEQHRIGMVDGALSALDHGPDEIRREELLAELTGTPLPCLQAIDTAHRRPDCLTGVRERLQHGDVAGALAVVEDLLGPDAVLRDGALRDELKAAARRRVAHGLYRTDLDGPGPGRVLPGPTRPKDHRSSPRHASSR